MTMKVAVLLLALLGAGCSRDADPGQASGQLGAPAQEAADNGDGRKYIDAFAGAMRKSDRIVITEHSNANDVLDMTTQPQRPVGYVPRIYMTHELTAGEREKFLASIAAMPARTQDAEPACIFDPHHTIAFFQGEKQTSAMVICFHCAQVEWDGTGAQRPWSLVPTLKPLLLAIGMQVERDWPALAKAASN